MRLERRLISFQVARGSLKRRSLSGYPNIVSQINFSYFTENTNVANELSKDTKTMKNPTDKTLQ